MQMDIPGIPDIRDQPYTALNKQSHSPHSNIIQLLGLESAQTIQYPCDNCRKLQDHLLSHQHLIEKKNKEIEVLRYNLNYLEEHNHSLMEETAAIINRLSFNYETLEQEVMDRNQANQRLHEELEVNGMLIEEMQVELQQKSEEFERMWGEREQQHRLEVENMRKQWDLSLMDKNGEISDLKMKVSKMITEKANAARLSKSEKREQEVEKFWLQDEIGRLETQLSDKEKLIKFLSQSNDDVRLELIEMKAKQEVNDMTWVTEGRRSLDPKPENMEMEKEKENQKLREVNEKLQAQLYKLTEELSRFHAQYEKLFSEKERMGRTINEKDEVMVNGKIRRQGSSGQESEKKFKKAGKKKPSLLLSFDEIPI